MRYLVLCFAILLTACIKEKVDQTTLPLQIEKPYAFATLPGTSTGAVFMTIKNTGENDTLIKAESKVAEITEIHQNIIDPDDGKMMMRKTRTLGLPANTDTILNPTGYHIMLIKLKEPLTIGIDVPLTLTFENMGSIDIKAEVIPPGTTPQE